ncbi:MAG: Ger(x)C family spore germination protein [Dehalobacter sp. 4CP]|uniref:Ger(x)C family spore germination protein n=1 Tax=Dehalobacter sp. CP TaxID=2594474 RepID=UPI0013C776D8|nr:Ger(x)C family spore germination protein [Dehalobacter sp. 4CP]
MLSLLLFCSGCWSSKEVETLAFVTLSSYDYTQINGQDVWTAATLILGTQGSQGQNQGKESGPKVNTEQLFTGRGSTMQDAIRNYSAKLSTVPFYGYATGFILGEEAAKEKAPEIIEHYARFPQTRPRDIIFVSKGEAKEILKTGGTMNQLFSEEVSQFIDLKATNTGKSYGMYFYKFVSWLTSTDRDAVLPQIKIIPLELDNKGSEANPKTEGSIIEGLGVFQSGHLVGWLDEEQTLGFLLLTQKINKGPISIPVQKDGTMFNYFLSGSTYKVKPVVSNEEISYQVTIQIKGEIDENNGLRLTKEDIEQLEPVISEKVKKIATSTVKQAKTYKADFLGFSEKLHQKDPKTFHALGSEWREAFVNANVEINVKAKIISTGRLKEKLEVNPPNE